MTDHPRYRTENGQPCVDIRVASVEQLFDNRDPAPFRDRDLDPDLVQYMRDAGEDLAPHGEFRLVFWIEKPCQPQEIEAAVHAHFAYEIDRIERGRRRQRRIGQVALLLGVGLVIVLQSIAQLVASTLPGSLGHGLREGLVIASWVVLWRPVEILIYDWIPVRRERRVIRRLLSAPIEVRAGAGPDARRPGAPGAPRSSPAERP